MSRRLLSHERLRGLVPHVHPLLPLSCPCIRPSSLLAQDNYQPTLLPKRVIGSRAIPLRASEAGAWGWDPHDRPCRATTQEKGWLLTKAWRMQVSIMAGEEESGKKWPEDDTRLNIYPVLSRTAVMILPHYVFRQLGVPMLHWKVK